MKNNTAIFQMEKRKVSVLKTILVIYFLKIINITRPEAAKEE